MKKEVQIKVNEGSLGLIEDKINKINKKAEKLNQPKITFETTGSKFVEDSKNPNIKKRVLYLTITGELPLLPGDWSFLATLLHLYGSEQGNVIQGTSNRLESIPECYRHSSANCDHCKSNRRRKKTYLLTNASGEITQVGSTCISDFLGSKNVETVFSYIEELTGFLDSIDSDEREFGGSGGEYYLDTENFVANAFASVRSYGYVSRANAEINRTEPTVSEVSSRMFNKYHENKLVREEDREKAKKAIQWINEKSKEGLNDYFHNLKVVCGSGYCTHSTFGLLASLPAAYNRHLGETTETKNSEHFGEVKKRQVFELTIKDMIPHEGYYGLTWIVKFEDKEGNQAVWFASDKPHYDRLSEDKQTFLYQNEAGRFDKLFVTATVKEHSEFRGVKQTTLTRCSLTEYEPNKANKKLIKSLKDSGNSMLGDCVQ